MTIETAKKLYDYYVSKGMKEQAEDIAKNRPDVLNVVKQEKKKKDKE